MSTNFPTSVDVFTNPSATNTMDGANGGAPVDHDVQHTNINDAVTAIEKVIVGPNVFNVVGYGAKGDGSTDDAAAIQSAVNARSPGGVVYFPPPSVTYLVGSTIVLPSPGKITILGPNGRINSSNTNLVVTMKAGANLDAVFAEGNWYNNVTGTISESIQFRDITIDANQSNQTGGLGHCIAGKYWRSQIAYCSLANARNNGIELSLTTRNGASVDSSNHCIENHFEDNIITGSSVCAIHTQGVNVTDNFIVDNVLIGTPGTSNHTGINFSGNGGAGTLIAGNHVYRSAQGISMSNVSLIEIVNNYIEPSNAGSGAGTIAAISLNIVGDEIVIANNKVGMASPFMSGTTYHGIHVESAALGYGVSIVGNTVGCTPQTISITAVSNAGGTITFTAANPNNQIVANAEVFITGLGATGFQSLNNGYVLVATANTTQFTVTSGLTGTTTTGTATLGTGSIGTGIYVNTHSFVNSGVVVSGNSVDPNITEYNLTNSPADSGAAFGLGIPTTATVGYNRLPSCAGPPTGTPLDLTQGIPMMFDTTNNKIWIYTSGAWKGVVVA